MTAYPSWARDLLRCRDSSSDTAGRQDVVFLDQNGIVEADAVVASASAQHRIFLRQAQTG